MGEKAKRDNKSQIKIILSIPRDIGYDLEEIASHNGITIEDLAFSYIVEGIAGDSRVLKRAEFKHQADKNLKHEDFHSKSAREIVNDFNLLY
jgi:hypothetical protein